MNNIPETINNVLEVLSTKFGTSVDHLWQVMIQQQIYEGKIHLVMGVLLGIIVMISIIAAVYYREIEPDNTLCFATLGIVMAALSIIILSVAYLEFVNPEYQALKEFLAVIKGQ